MRVLLVNDYPVTSGYGAEAFVRRLAGGLSAAGDEVSIWAGEIHHEGFGRWRDIWDPQARRRLAARVEADRPDVVHFHNVTRECSASVLAATDVPAVMTVHDHRILGIADQVLHGPGGWLTSRGAALSGAAVRRRAKKRLAATMAVSDELAISLHHLGFPAVSITPVPVDEPVCLPRPVVECTDIAVVGRLSPDKGPDVTLAAFAEIAHRHPETNLVFAGDGLMRRQLEAFATPLGDRVQFRGRLEPDEVSRLIGRSRCVVAASVPSRRPEGSPTVVVEAAAHGRPLIASDDPGLKNAAGRLGGSVITAALDVAALAAALDQILGDDQQAVTLGTAAKAAVFARHGVPQVTEIVRGVYRSALTGSDRG